MPRSQFWPIALAFSISDSTSPMARLKPEPVAHHPRCPSLGPATKLAKDGGSGTIDRAMLVGAELTIGDIKEAEIFGLSHAQNCKAFDPCNRRQGIACARGISFDFFDPEQRAGVVRFFQCFAHSCANRVEIDGRFSTHRRRCSNGCPLTRSSPDRNARRSPRETQ